MTNAIIRARLLAGTVGAAMALLAASAQAQGLPPSDRASAEARMPGEIVVTARSRGENLMQVPVAVTAISATEIARYNTTDLVKLAQQRPDVEIYGGGSRLGASFIIRGVGTTADTAGVESSVSVNFDGTQTHRPRIIHAGLFDIQQIEIMKGPQALFFGKNSSAGVVSITSADPTGELSGYVRGGYELEARERYIEGAISVPVTETLGVRFAGRYSRMRGWTKNIAEARPDPENPSVILPAPAHRYMGAEALGGRITVKWQPAPNYTATFKAQFASYEDDGPLSNAEVKCSPDIGNSVFISPTLGTVFTAPHNDCRLNGVTASTNMPPLYTTSSVGDPRWNAGVPFTDTTNSLYTLQQNLTLGDFTIRSATGHSRLTYIDRGLFNASEFASFAGGSHETWRGWSQELRLVSDFASPFNFTLGAFYERTRLSSGSALYLMHLGPDPTTGSYATGLNDSSERQKTLSAFAQARWDILDNLELAGGARYTKVKKRASQGQIYVHDFAEGFLLGEGILLHDRLSEDNVSPEVTLTWNPDPDSTLYAAYKTGYKTGGIAQPSLVTPGNIGTTVFRPEKARGGEIGFKSLLADRRLRFIATAFYYKFKGLQLTSFDPTVSSYRINNAADVKQKGLEVEAQFQATDHLSLTAAGSYTSVKYGTFLNATCWASQTADLGCIEAEPGVFVQDLTGHQLHRAPKWSGNVGATYDLPLGNDFTLGFTGDAIYRSGTHTTDVQAPADYQKGHVLLNASVRLANEADTNWELAIIGRNLTNKRLTAFALDLPGGGDRNITPGLSQIQAWTVRPREIALQASLRF